MWRKYKFNNMREKYDEKGLLLAQHLAMHSK